MKLLFITSLYPNKPGDYQSSLTLHYYVKEWIKKHHVEVVCVHTPNILEYWKYRKKKYPERFERNGVTIHNKLVLRLPFELIINPSFDSKFINQFDALIGHLPRGAALAYYFAKKFDAPFIMGIHPPDFKRSKGSTGRITTHYKKMLRSACAVAFRTEFLKTKFERLLPEIDEKTFLMPEGILKSWVGHVSSRNVNDSKNVGIVTAAKLIEQQNIRLIVETLRLFSSQNWSYYIAGEGLSKKEVTNIVGPDFSHLDVTYYDHLPSNEVRKLMDSNEIFIMVNENETLVCLEAMARGCLVISKIGGGLSGIIKDGENGFFTQPGIGALTDTLKRIIDLSQSEKDKISKNAIATASNLTHPVLADLYLSTIAKFLNG